MSTGFLLLLSYVALVSGVNQNLGFYTPAALFLVLLSFVLLVAASIAVLRAGKVQRPTRMALLLAVLLMLALSALELPGIYIQSQQYAVLYFYSRLLVFFLLPLLYLFPRQQKIRPWGFLTIVIVAFAFRVWMPIVSPNPTIDVFIYIQDSAKHFLQGMNPYTIPFDHRLSGIRVWNVGYPYPPGGLYLHTLGYLLLGDARYIYILAEAVFCFTLWHIAGRNESRVFGELLVLLFLSHPHGTFVLEQAWTEPLILLSLSLFLLSKIHGKETLAAAVQGYMLHVKQYLLYFAIHWLMMMRRRLDFLMGVFVMLLVPLPFLLVDMSGFWNAITVHFEASIAFHTQSLSISTFLYRNFGVAWGVLTGPIIGAIFAVGTFFLFRKFSGIFGYLFAATLTTFSMFALGGQAYSNQYYLIAGLLLLLIAVQGERKLLDRTPVRD